MNVYLWQKKTSIKYKRKPNKCKSIFYSCIVKAWKIAKNENKIQMKCSTKRKITFKNCNFRTKIYIEKQIYNNTSVNK